MQEALLLLFLVILAIILFINMSNKTEEFTDLNNQHSEFVNRQFKQWGNIGVSLITSKKDGTLGDSADKMLQTVGENKSYSLNTGKNGLFDIIDKCEAIKTTDCNAFDDTTFSMNCGMCLDIGENSEHVKATGGLVLLPDDKKAAKDETQSNFLPNYKPTIGFCPAGKMVASKKECLKLKRQLLCEKNSNYDQPGCSQCYSDGSYSIVDPKTSPGVISGLGVISIIGVGVLAIQEAGYSAKNGIILNATKPYNYTVRAKDANRIKLTLQPPSNSDPDNPTVPYIAGILNGETGTGEFTIDLRRLVLVDEFTGRKPRSNGKDTMSGTTVTRMSPGYGQTTAAIVVVAAFSFTDTTTSESTLCKDAPFITTKESAEFLDSDPCYKKDSGPGKFSLECLQGIWSSNNCTEAGKGYPSDTKKAAALMTGKDGTFLTLNDISNLIYTNAIISSTGVNEKGVKQEIKEWSNASVFCTGNELLSPCDTSNKNSGPLSPDCITYLWNNQGAKKTWQGKDSPIGSTYYTSNSVSLFKNDKDNVSQYCQATGTLSPIDANGNKKKDVIQYWQKQGGVDNVKRVMADLHRAANAQRIADDKLAPYFNQCYGDIEFAQRPSTKFSIPNNMLPETFTIKKGNVLVNSLAMTQDYKLQFVIKPKSTSTEWSNIMHFTANECDWSATEACRSPGIWFWPNELKLHVIIGGVPDANWGIISIPGCELNKESMFSLECRGTSVKVTLDDKVFTATHPGYRYSGNLKVYGSGPWHAAVNADIKDVGLQLFGNSITVNKGPWKVNVGNSNTVEKAVPLPSGISSTARNIKIISQGHVDDFVSSIQGNNLVVRRVDSHTGWGASYVAEISEGDLPSIANVGFVRIEGGKCLNLSQLVVLDEKGNNISQKRPVQSSGSPYSNALAEMANDGGEAPRPHPNEFHGKCDGKDLWQVQLDGAKKVSAVLIYNRSDCCADRMADGFVIKLFTPTPNPRQLFVSNKLNAKPVQIIRTR